MEKRHGMAKRRRHCWCVRETACCFAAIYGMAPRSIVSPARRYLIKVHYQSVFMHQASVPATQTQSWDPRCLALLIPQRRRLFRDHGDHPHQRNY